MSIAARRLLRANLGGITSVPPAIAGLRQVQVTTTSVDLAWDPQNYITNYKIQYRQNGTTAWTLSVHPTLTTPEYTVNGLSNGTAYDFRVCAVNIVGQGAWSAPITTSTNGASAKMLIGGRNKTAANRTNAELSADFTAMNASIGPLSMTRAFEQTLPSSWVSVSAPGVAEFISYKSSGTLANFTAYLNSVPANSRVIFYHEPEGPTDWPSGADFVAAFVAEYDKAKSIRPEIPFGMVAGGFQYRNSTKNGWDGSYLPPANKVDFYAFDTYRDGVDSFGEIIPLEQIAEFQRWLSFVQNRGKDLYLTEYGRGIVGANELPGTPALRASTMNTDHAYLQSLGFKGWLYWFCNYGPDGRAWQFVDQGSIDAWSSIATANT